MGTTITLLADLYAHVGPGLLLAFALPALLLVFGVILLQAVRRARSRQEQVAESA
jgi:cytochrome c-type biogenesis protein CcmH/NrfF